MNEAIVDSRFPFCTMRNSRAHRCSARLSSLRTANLPRMGSFDAEVMKLWITRRSKPSILLTIATFGSWQPCECYIHTGRYVGYAHQLSTMMTRNQCKRD